MHYICIASRIATVLLPIRVSMMRRMPDLSSILAGIAHSLVPSDDGVRRRFIVLDKPKRQQPDRRRQQWQAARLDSFEPSHRGSKQHGMPRFADNTRIVADAVPVGVPCTSRRRPPQPEFNRRPGLGVGCCSHGPRDAGERRVRCKRASKFVDNGVGRPDPGDVLKWHGLLFAELPSRPPSFPKHLIAFHRQLKHFVPQIFRNNSSIGGRYRFDKHHR